MPAITYFRDPFAFTATSGLEKTLRRVFNESVDLIPLSRELMTKPSLWKPEFSFMFVKPGITGTRSRYNEIFTDNIFRLEKEHLENGGVQWAECAGAYHSFDGIKWEPLQGEHREKTSSTPHIGGNAIGPISELYNIAAKENSQYSDIVLPRIDVVMDGIHKTITIAYGNGPALHPEDESAQIIARFSDVKNTPAAVVEKTIRNDGLLVASGVIPQYGWMRHGENTPKSMKDFMDILKGHELDRELFSDALMARLARRSIDNGLITEDVLTKPLSEFPTLGILPNP
ncbi:MAG: hypothetical protein CL565_01555 [Alphaproteobacteria bacterium]|nr:hypothetical protein [Alphaproteobacteria bacterium]